MCVNSERRVLDPDSIEYTARLPLDLRNNRDFPQLLSLITGPKPLPLRC